MNSTGIDIPEEPGYYVLIISVNRELVITTRGGRRFHLKPGIYAYIGSARGLGGIKARILRHLRRDKKKHWHIDYLTTNPWVEIVAALSFTWVEKDLESILSNKLAGKHTPVKGFGSTDKRSDPSHLFYCGSGSTETIDKCIDDIYRIAFAEMKKPEFRFKL